MKFIISGTDECLESWFKKKNVNNKLTRWVDWMKRFCEKALRERIKTLIHKYINNRSSILTLKNDIITRSLDILLDNFVMVSIDKANGNKTTNCKLFICKC